MELNENSPLHLTQIQIVAPFVVSKARVSNIAPAYVKDSIPAIIGINRNPRSNARRKLDGMMETELIRIVCGPAPDGHVQWTLRLFQIRSKLNEPIGRETIRFTLK